tara:strand:- start:743 stop:1333 length:591 start_codon:yes stop_codon:yes gene_type:complete
MNLCFDIIIKIITYNNYYEFYKIKLINKSLYNEIFDNNLLMNSIISLYFNEININNNYDNSKLFENLIILNYFFCNQHLKILDTNKIFLKYLKNNNWANYLYTYNFKRNMNINNNIIVKDNTIKDNIMDIMKIMYFKKILDDIEKNQKQNIINKQDKYNIGIAFYKIKIDLLERSEIIKEEMLFYINYNYPNFKFT